jgi:hypothetical protein
VDISWKNDHLALSIPFPHSIVEKRVDDDEKEEQEQEIHCDDMLNDVY